MRLALGNSLACEPKSSLPLVKLAVLQVATSDVDDENVSVVLAVTDADTRTALLDGISQATGAKVNGTVALTVTNQDTLGSNSARTGTKTFNVFQYNGANQAFYFLATAASNITISSADDYNTVDLTDATFLDSGGSDANLDAAGSGEIYNFSAVLSIPGFEDSDAVAQNNISIDAA
jgi:hypothetical protein|tara:strand:- start:175 stop:705 length:531 start_codon:yes stop_codon:yes gene_type:complete